MSTPSNRNDDQRRVTSTNEAPAVANADAPVAVRLSRWAAKGFDLGPVILPQDRPSSRASDTPNDVVNACRLLDGLPPLASEA